MHSSRSHWTSRDHHSFVSPSSEGARASTAARVRAFGMDTRAMTSSASPASRDRSAPGILLRPGIAWLALFFSLAWHPALAADAVRVVVIVEQEQAVYRQLIDGIERGLRRNGDSKATLSVHDLSRRESGGSEPALPAAELYVAAGTEAAVRVAGIVDGTPLIGVLVPRLSFEKLFPNGGRSRTRSAIFLDQPFERQLDLIRLVLPDSRRIGVALGPDTNGFAAELSRAGAARGFRLQPRMLSPNDNLVRELDRLLPESDALLGIVDPLVFNRANAHKILLTAYRHRVPLIGASPAYVRAGALAAVYSTPEQIGRELGEIVAQWRNVRELPPPRHPRYFSVMVNRQVAASLGLLLVSDEQLTQRLGAMP